MSNKRPQENLFLCNFGCGKKITLQTQNYHENTDCPLATIRCPAVNHFCNWYGPRKNLENHKSRCQFAQLLPVIQAISGHYQMLYKNQQDQITHLEAEVRNQSMKITQLQDQITARRQQPPPLNGHNYIYHQHNNNIRANEPLEDEFQLNDLFREDQNSAKTQQQEEYYSTPQNNYVELDPDIGFNIFDDVEVPNTQVSANNVPVSNGHTNTPVPTYASDSRYTIFQDNNYSNYHRHTNQVPTNQQQQPYDDMEDLGFAIFDDADMPLSANPNPKKKK